MFIVLKNRFHQMPSPERWGWGVVLLFIAALLADWLGLAAAFIRWLIVAPTILLFIAACLIFVVGVVLRLTVK